ncbi:uncharacterized protein [Halyomorpha halys]|uniref:uncharacterized protein n=1 Tax=Halyomorpha halys TaxID=286706 RepID=UPI0006D515D3|nr:uncharacterized protein LOC106679960 [Halyomorpha halys]
MGVLTEDFGVDDVQDQESTLRAVQNQNEQTSGKQLENNQHDVDLDQNSIPTSFKHQNEVDENAKRTRPEQNINQQDVYQAQGSTASGIKDQKEQKSGPEHDCNQQDVYQEQGSTQTDIENQNEQIPGQQQDDYQDQGNTLNVLWIPTKQESVPVSPRESSLTMISEYDSSEYLMENFNFSFTSLKETEKSTTPEPYFCRICHQRSLSERNLTPCNCRGTMAYIHKSCLERWLATSDSDRCELCHFNFTIRRNPKFGILKGIKIWLRSEECRSERVYLTYDVVRLIVSLPLILFLNHLTTALFEIFLINDIENGDFYSFLSNAESQLHISSMKDLVIVTGRILTYFCLGFTSAMDVFAVGCFFSRIEEHYQMWHKWYRTQCTIDVILPETPAEEMEKKTNE